jgi:hypothetical protein
VTEWTIGVDTGPRLDDPPPCTARVRGPGVRPDPLRLDADTSASWLAGSMGDG